MPLLVGVTISSDTKTIEVIKTVLSMLFDDVKAADEGAAFSGEYVLAVGDDKGSIDEAAEIDAAVTAEGV